MCDSLTLSKSNGAITCRYLAFVIVKRFRLAIILKGASGVVPFKFVELFRIANKVFPSCTDKQIQSIYMFITIHNKHFQSE